MKVKVDGMSEKPANTAAETLPDTGADENVCADVTHSVCYTREDFTEGLCETRADKGPVVAFELSGDEGEEGDREQDQRLTPLSHVGKLSDTSCELRSALEVSDEETLELPDSASKPDPPPRSDSHGYKPRVRHMVDMLGGYEHEETFSWDTSREYPLACMGFVNGLGCLLKSSTLIMKHGGGVFIVAYVICTLVFGCPLVYLESTLGQYADGGPVTAWRVLPIFNGVGYSMVCLSFLLSIFYVMEITWAIYYFGIAISTALGAKQLPWQCTNISDSSCDGVEERQFYISEDLPHYSNKSTLPYNDIPYSKQYLGSIQYFYASVLEVSESISDIGCPVWYILLCLLFVWVCVYACLVYGPSSIGKIMYVLAPYPYIALPVLFVFSCFSDGSLDGVKYFLSPVWHKLGAIQIWYDAGSLVFYTLGLGTGCIHTLSGYTHFHSHCYRNLILICVCNVVGVMFGGLTLCSGLGILANITNTTVHNMTTATEYELGYALYPYILTQVSESSALMMLYFSTLFILGLSTLVVFTQTIMAAMLEVLLHYGIPCTRMKRWLIQLSLCILLLLIGTLFTTKIGLYAVYFLDSYVSQISPYIVVLFECILLMYIYGGRKFVHNIEDMTGHKNSPWWICNWKFLSPLIILGLISCTVLYPVQLTYRDILYPDWSEVLGWCLSLGPVMCIPVVAVRTLCRATGSLSQRIKHCLSTPATWGPGLINNHEHNNSAPDYVICHPDNYRPSHGLAMLTAHLYVPQLPPLTADNVPGKTSSDMTGGYMSDLILQVPGETSSDMTGGYMSDLMTITSSDSIDSGPENEERGNWRGKLEFVLSCLGYVVGLGNIWRFPYLVYRNGGGAFFIPYLIMVLFCGLPLVYMEMAFGQYASLGPITIWRALPLFKGVGYAMVVTVGIVSVYYNIVNAWAFHYLFSSFTATLPWASCDNPWNTPACNLNKYAVSNCSLVNMTYMDSVPVSNHSCTDYLHSCVQADNNSTLFPQQNTTDCIKWLLGIFGEDIYLPERKAIMARLRDPSEEYFYNAVLNQSTSLQEMGGVQWQLALYLLLCWVIVFLCLVKGIYSAGKVAYFVVIIPVILLVVLLICAMLVEGHLAGIRFYVTPKWDQFLSLRVWSDAASQVFFSLSACTGGLTTLSSYNKFHNNIYRDALLICVIDTLMSILAGFTVFASMGILAHQLNTTVENVVTSNTGLVFVAFPAAVTNFQPAAMWSAFFFLMIIMMGMSSILVMTEIIVTVVMDENVDMFRKSRICVLFVVCSLLYLLGLPLTTRGGSFLLEMLDEYCGGLPNVVIGLFMCLGLAWVYKVRHFCTDIRLMIGRPVNWWWKAMWCFISPIIMLFILVSNIISGEDLDAERYPAWSEVLGILLTIFTVISIPLYAAKKVCGLEGSLTQRLREACLAQDNWGPALVKHWKHVEYYPAVNTHTLSVDAEHSPVHAISDGVNLSTSDVRLPHLSEASLLSHNHQMSQKKPQELRQRAILNHAYSNPQCHISNGSIDEMKSQLSLHEPPGTSTVLLVSRKKPSVKCHDAAVQTDARSYTLALKQGSVKSLKEMKIEAPLEIDSNVSKCKTSSHVLHVEVTKF